MPAFEAQETLDEAVASVVASSHPHWELILVDDGSSDRTLELAEGWAQREARIRVLPTSHQGLVGALNAGLEICRAPWVARLDADDMMTPDRLLAQKRLIDADPQLVLVGGRVELFPPEEIRGGLMRYVEWLNELQNHTSMKRDLFVEAPVSHGAATFHRETVQSLGGYRHGNFPEDYDLWLRLYRTGKRFAACPEVVLKWRHRAGRLTFTDPRYNVEAFRRLKIELLLETKLKDATQIAIVGSGRDGKAWVKALKPHGLAVSHWIEVNERKLGTTIHNAPVIGYSDLPRYRDDLPHILVTVGIKGAREQIRQELTALGLHEGDAFTCVA